MTQRIIDRVTQVQFLLENRTDIDKKIYEWLGEAYVELASSIPFPELEETYTTPFLNGVSSYAYPPNARALKSVVGVMSGGGTYPIFKRDIRVIDRYNTTTISVRPGIWAPYKNNMIFRPIPSGADTLQIRYWLKPVLRNNEDTPDITNPELAANHIEDTELFMPDDWLTILDHVAAMMGKAGLGQIEKAQQISMLLHGDPKHPEKPGWIKRKLLRNAAEYEMSDYAMVPTIQQYTER